MHLTLILPIITEQGSIYIQILDEHLTVPMARQFEQVFARRDLRDETTNGVVRPAKVSLCLELDIGHQPALRAADERVIAEFVLHLAKEDAPCIHVWLRDEAVSLVSQTISTLNDGALTISPLG